jgi:hypothetical protein
MREQTEETDARPSALGSERRRIGELLIAEGTITATPLQQALDGRVQTAHGRERLGEAIIHLGFASDEDVARGSRASSATSTSCKRLVAEDDAVAIVPASLAERHNVLPHRRRAAAGHDRVPAGHTGAAVTPEDHVQPRHRPTAATVGGPTARSDRAAAGRLRRRSRRVG